MGKMENSNSNENFLPLGPRLCLADFFEEEIPNLERNIYHLLFPSSYSFYGVATKDKGEKGADTDVALQD